MPTVAAPPVPQIQNTTDHEIESPKKNRIQVSNTKKPLFFYVNLAKVISIYFSFNSLSKRFLLSLSQRYIQQRDEVVLSALGMGTSSLQRSDAILIHGLLN